MIDAYILLQTEVGKADEVAIEIAGIEGVIESRAVASGPYDLVVRLVDENIDELGKIIANEINIIRGVTRTIVMVMKLCLQPIFTSSASAREA